MDSSFSTRAARTHPVIVADPPVAGGQSLLGYAGLSLAGIGLGLSILAVSSLPPNWLPLFVMAALLPLLAMIVGSVRKTLLAAVFLDIPFQLDIHLGYRPEVAELGSIGGFGVSVTTVSLAVLYASWLGRAFTRSEPQSRPVLRTALPAIVYLAFVLSSLLVARDPYLSLVEIALLVQVFLVYLYLVYYIRTRQDVVFVLGLLLLGLLMESLVLIGVFFAGQDLSLGPVFTYTLVQPTGESWRSGGTLVSPIVAAAYFSLLLAPAASVLLTRLHAVYKWLAAFSFALGSLALLFTLSRGGWIAFALSISLCCLLAWRQGWLSPTVPVVLCLTLVLLFVLFQDTIVTRLTADDNRAAFSRIPLMQLAFRIITDNPLLGVGANNFAVAMPEYSKLGFSREWLYTVHNKYLLVWAETGIGGLLAFLFFLLAILRRGWHTYRLRDPLLSALALGFTAAIAGQMVHMFVDTFNNRPQVQLLWVVAALISAMSRIAAPGQSSTPLGMRADA
jgi:putative inorganic carbon (HCO3(-)) transporter